MLIEVEDKEMGDVLTLYIDTPLRLLQPKGLKSTLLTQDLGLIDKFITTVVSGTWIAFRVFVCKKFSANVPRLVSTMTQRTLHDTSQRVEHSLGGEVLRWNQVDEVLLPSLLL
jgi:hypothetical protein